VSGCSIESPLAVSKCKLTRRPTRIGLAPCRLTTRKGSKNTWVQHLDGSIASRSSLNFGGGAVRVSLPISQRADVSDIEEAFAAVHLGSVNIAAATTVEVRLQTQPIATELSSLAATCETKVLTGALTTDQDFILAARRGGTSIGPMAVLLLHFEATAGTTADFIVSADLLLKGQA
jgi:hypothetical protein